MLYVLTFRSLVTSSRVHPFPPSHRVRQYSNQRAVLTVPKQVLSLHSIWIRWPPGGTRIVENGEMNIMFEIHRVQPPHVRYLREFSVGDQDWHVWDSDSLLFCSRADCSACHCAARAPHLQDLVYQIQA